MKKRNAYPTSAGMQKALCNPAYCKILAHRSLIEERPRDYDPALFTHIAHETARKEGAAQAIRQFLKELREGGEWIALIPIHPSLAEERPDMLWTEEEFIIGAADLIQCIKFQKYLPMLIDNAAQGVLGYAPREAKP